MMIDREKVIKAIEICYTSGHNCTECSLFKKDDCNDELMHNVLFLLNEQEPKMGKWILDDEDANSWECSECGGLLIINDGTPHENDWHFCPYCGTKLEEQEVKLDD